MPRPLTRDERVRHRLVQALALAALCAAASGADAGVVILNTDLTRIHLGGSGEVPLAYSGDSGDDNHGFALVDAAFDVVPPTGLTSTGTTTIDVDTTTGTVSFSTSFDFYLAVTITETTTGSFAPGLGGQVVVPADPADPLTASLVTSFAFADLLDILNGTITPMPMPGVSDTQIHPLGVDVNHDGTLDSISLDALDINFLAEDDISFDLGAGSTVDDLSTAILAASLNSGDPIVLEGTLAIAALDVELTGEVNPRFSVPLSGSIGTVPLPPALVLLGSGVLTLGRLRRASRPA